MVTPQNTSLGSPHATGPSTIPHNAPQPIGLSLAPTAAPSSISTQAIRSMRAPAPNALQPQKAQPYTPSELHAAHAAFEKLRSTTFTLPRAYHWMDTHARFIFEGNLTLESLDHADRQALTDFTDQLNLASLYLFGLLDPTSHATTSIHRLRRHLHQRQLRQADNNADNSPVNDAEPSVLAQLLSHGVAPEYLVGDLLGLKLLHEDNLLKQLEFDFPTDFRRFARIYTLAKNLYATVDPEDEYIHLTDAYHPKNVISYLQDKGDIALLTAAAFHDFERYVPGIRTPRLPCGKLDETIRKQAMHPLNSANLALRLLQKSPLNSCERADVFSLIRNHDAGPDGLTLEGYSYVPSLSGVQRNKLIELTNADTAAFFDFSPMQDPTVEVFVKNSLEKTIEKVLAPRRLDHITLSDKSKEQLANLALTQIVADIQPLNLKPAIVPTDHAQISDMTPLETALAKTLEKLSARITKHAKRISPAMLGTVARLHAQRPRTQIDALIHSALQHYDQMDKNLKSLKGVALAVMAAESIAPKAYLKTSGQLKKPH